MDRWGSFTYHEPTRPLEAETGIPARSRRGAIGETWWSRRFIELLESFGVGSRLKRGRSYARSGQVCELEVEAGIVLADVQGSRHTPYRVRIRAKILSEAEWRRAENAIAGQALLLAKLLAGEMPHEIEEVLGTCKVKLFPASGRELTSTCTCPDRENPCKHIAAVFYILAEQFDADPFLIFAWRGRTQEELLERLRTVRLRSLPRGAGPPVTARQSAEPVDLYVARPLTELIENFWTAGPELAELRISPLAGAAPDAVLRRVGPVPAQTASGRDVGELLAPVYARMAELAEQLALE